MTRPGHPPLAGALAMLAALALGAAPTAAQQAPASPPADSTAPVPRPRGATFLIPGVGYAPETGVAFTPTFVRLWRLPGATRPSNLVVSALGSTRGQFALAASARLWTRDDRDWIQLGVEASRVRQPFFGVGPSAPLEAREDYTPRVLALSALVQRRVARGLYAGGALDVSDTRITRTDPAGVLAEGTLSGSRGSTVVGFGPAAALDRRDDVVFTRRGYLLQLSSLAYPVDLGSSTGFVRASAEARGFLPLRTRGVLALQATVDLTAGDAPFDQLPTFGGDNLKRGYLRGRFRDYNMVVAQAELRQPIAGRLGVTLFAAAGEVLRRLADAGPDRMRPSGGAGLRWLLLSREQVWLRVDYGITRDSRGLYVAVGESF